MTHVVAPRLSEKAFAAAGSDNAVYTFVVPADTNKHEVKKTVESLYGVTVVNVNVSVLKGKTKRFMQKRGRQSIGDRQNVKKAYVTLKAGDSIAVFAGEEESKTPAIATGRTKTKKEKK